MSISQLFTIKDKNIEINSFQETIYKNKKTIVIEENLVRTFRHCPFCKESAKQIVKNGKKISMVLLNRSGNKQTYLRLRKQRYHCRACGKYFTAHTYLVAPSCFISKQVHYTILEELTERQALKTIAKRCDLSVMTVQRTLSALLATVRQKLDYLPQCLLFDEFRSLSTSYGKFSSPFLVWMERQENSLTSCPAGEKKIWLLISCVLQEKLGWGFATLSQI